MDTYVPAPIDTSSIELPEDLLTLIEKLADNNHDVWAKLRMDEGWKMGPARDDSRKTHPDLIPYKQLSESAKQYDRQAVIEMLRATIAFGYRIIPPD